MWCEEKTQMFPLDVFQKVQNENTEKLSEHLRQLQRTMHEANELHRDQIELMRQVLQGHGKDSLSDPAASLLAEVRPKKRASEKSTASHELPAPQKIGLIKEESKLLEDQFMGTVPSSHPTTQKTMRNPFRKKDPQPEMSHKSSHPETHYLPLKVTKNWIFLWGSGFSRRQASRLLDYNFDSVQAYAAIPAAFSPRASIFILRRSLLFQILCQPILIATVALTVHVFRDDELPDRAFPDSPFGKSLKFCNDALQRLVPFLLGLFLSLQLRRWWTIRSNYLNKIHQSTMQISLMLGLVFPESTDGFRLRVERYLLASHKMIYLIARQKATGTITYDSLVQEGVLTEEEMVYLRTAIDGFPEVLQGRIGSCDMALAGVPVTWAAHLIYRIFMFSKAPEAAEFNFDFPVNLMVQLLMQCVTIKKSIQDIEMILSSPLPFPFVHLVALAVHMLAVFSCVEAGVFIGAGNFDTLHFCMHSCGVMILNGMYLGMLCMSALIWNPFTDECVDFPAANFHCRLRKAQLFARQIYNTNNDIDDEIHMAHGLNRADAKVRGVKEREDDTVDDDVEDDDDGEDEENHLDF